MITVDIVIVFAIVAVAVVLFLTEWVRYDGVAIIVLLALALSGVIPMNRAIDGFANPAVITIAAVLVLSGGLHRTGVANLVGAQMMRFAGKSSLRVTGIVMLTSGLMSGVMNNIAATALLLPVVLNMAWRLRIRPSRLLIPLAFASLLGGMTTLIGTGPNILLAAFLERSEQGTFGLFSFTPVGAVALFLGIIYMVFVGRHFLPDRPSDHDASSSGVDPNRYGLKENLVALRVPRSSALNGKSLEQARLGRAAGVEVLAIRRKGQYFRAPHAGFLLRSGDILHCKGGQVALDRLLSWGRLTCSDESVETVWEKIQANVALARVEITANSSLIGSSVQTIDFRNRFRAHIVAFRRGQNVRQSAFENAKLQLGDTLLLLGDERRLKQLERPGIFSSVTMLDLHEAKQLFGLDRWLMRLEIPKGSRLHGKTLAASRLWQGFDLTVVEIQRSVDSGPENSLLPQDSATLRSGDRLIVNGNPESCVLLAALQKLRVHDDQPSVSELASDQVAFAELTLSPTSNIVGKNWVRAAFGNPLA